MTPPISQYLYSIMNLLRYGKLNINTTNLIRCKWTLQLFPLYLYLCHIMLCGSQDMYDRFGVVAVVVLPYIGDSGEG